jgi:hypothetical protein
MLYTIICTLNVLNVSYIIWLAKWQYQISLSLSSALWLNLAHINHGAFVQRQHLYYYEKLVGRKNIDVSWHTRLYTHYIQSTPLTLKLYAHLWCIDWFIQHFNSEWLIEIWTYLVFYSTSVQKIGFSFTRKIENDFNKIFQTE